MTWPKEGEKGFLFVFDFEKAKKTLESEEHDYAMAGLWGDWSNTADIIEFAGEWKIGHAYLHSDHAKPTLVLYRECGDGWHCKKTLECWLKKPAVYHGGWQLVEEAER